MRFHTLFLSLGILFFTPFFFAQAAEKAECAHFSRALKLGMSGEDVRFLQVTLNTDIRTQISESGNGSPGHESNYFGSKTKIAVQKFQELYKDETLTPAGLAIGNGFVGQFTRNKLTKYCGEHTKGVSTIPVKDTVSPLTPPLSTTTNNPMQSALLIAGPTGTTSGANVLPYIISPENYAVPQGGKLVIYGGGFTPTGNTIIVGNTRYAGISPTYMGALEVQIPSDAPTGKFDLKFMNQKGESNKTFIVITTPNSVAPKVKGFSPSTGVVGTKVTITGENFSKEWNDIVVGANRVSGVASSDGTTLTFIATLPIPTSSSTKVSVKTSPSMPLWFYVVSPSGISDASVFTIISNQ